MLGVAGTKAEAAVKAGAVGGHQINPFCLGHGWAGQQFGHQAPAQAQALVLACHHHIPEHGAEGPIAAGPAKTHQLLALPSAHHRLAALEHGRQFLALPSPSPEAVVIEERLQGP